MSDVCDVCERPKCCDARARWLAATSGTFDACQMKATECHGGGPCWKLGYTSLRTALSAAEGREAALRGALGALRAALDSDDVVIDLNAALASIDAVLDPTPATEPRTP